jgi:hypothetical protein
LVVVVASSPVHNTCTGAHPGVWRGSDHIAKLVANMVSTIAMHCELMQLAWQIANAFNQTKRYTVMNGTCDVKHVR